jgi:predicted MFS family arabinose efflux permease
VFVERRAADPLVPLGLFRLRGLVGAALVAFALTAATAPVGVLVTLYLQNTLGYSASFAGLSGLPFSLCVIAGSVLGGRIAGRKGGRATMSLGLAVVAASALVATGITAERGVGYVLAGAALSGLGLGCASVASTARGTSAGGGKGTAVWPSGFHEHFRAGGTALGWPLSSPRGGSHRGLVRMVQNPEQRRWWRATGSRFWSQRRRSRSAW